MNYDPPPIDTWKQTVKHGMSLLDYFAGQALAGFCADSEHAPSEDLADKAYRTAAAMLAERELRMKEGKQ